MSNNQNINLLGRVKAISDISEALAIYRHKIEQDQSLTIYSLNIIAENYFIDVLNFLYNYNLKNTNLTQKNTPYVDLIDSDKKIAYQITTTRTKEKIKKTLIALTMPQYKDYKIKIYFLLNKPKFHKQTIQDLQSEYKIENLKECLLDYTDLMKDINNLETHKLIELRDIYFVFDKNLNKKNDNTNWELILANLIGSWDENNENDKSIIADIIGEDYHQWIKKIRPFLHQENSPITLHNGIWTVSNRVEIFSDLAQHIYNDELNRLKDGALNIFKEKDPRFELQISEKYLANIQNKTFKHSAILRQGIAETLFIIGNNNNKLIHCDFNKRTGFSWLIRDIFQDANWILWGSLGRLLPTLAKANPKVFLNQVQEVITKKPELFIELFKQEGDAMFGGSETTGLLWALEALAWDEGLFAQTCMVFAALAEIDPGGRMLNRPKNSLSIILLPCLPRTNASVEKQKYIVKTITTKHPSVAWDLLLTLLPNQQQNSMQTSQPTELKINTDEKKSVSWGDYLNQGNFYADLIVSMAKYNIDKLIVLVKDIEHLTEKPFNQLLKQISSSEIIKLSEERRLPLYFSMIDLIRKHTKFQKTDWAISIKKIKQIEQIAEKIKPQDLFNLYQRLFINNNLALYEELGSFDKQRELLADKQKKAVKDIFEKQGLDKIIEFSLMVENSILVGNCLSQIPNVDKTILPKFLMEKDKKKDFIYGYVHKKYQDNGLKWLNSLNVSEWSKIEKANLLKNIDSGYQVWEKASEWLDEQENLYWDEVFIHSYKYTKNEFIIAIDKLLKYRRPNTAISVLQAMIDKQFPLDIKRSVEALLACGKTNQKNKFDYFERYNTFEVIKLLQQSPDVSQEDLFSIECMYLANMNSTDTKLKPITIENKMATDPDFFCELMQYAFCSKKDNDTVKKELNEQEKNIAQTSYNLLHHWKTIPGFTNGNFSNDDFNYWLKSVKDKCKKSGHLDIAMQIIGQTLIHTPKDKSGLWINKDIAQVLNDEPSEHLGRGFHYGIINSRGVCTVDPMGNQEDKISDKYLQQANELEKNGYINFAKTLKEISYFYKGHANRVRDENRK